MLGSAAASSSIVLAWPPASSIDNKVVKLQQPFISILSKPSIPSNLIRARRTHCSRSGFLASEETSESLWEVEDDEIGEDAGDSPWEGAVLYTRNAAISHLEFSTTLERLGLDKVSSEFSKNRASEMGLRLVKSRRDCPQGTPVLISMDVTRRKHRLRLDGIIRTILSLNCNRCGEPAAQSVFSDFSLLLRDEPIPEPDAINMGTLSGDDKRKPVDPSEETEDAVIDVDDQLYFPQHQKSIDISKNIRDMVHVEINNTAVCDPKCKGLCLKCGANLNNSGCACKSYEAEEQKGHGPLGHLRKQMQNI